MAQAVNTTVGLQASLLHFDFSKSNEGVINISDTHTLCQENMWERYMEPSQTLFEGNKVWLRNHKSVGFTSTLVNRNTYRDVCLHAMEHNADVFTPTESTVVLCSTTKGTEELYSI